jgi:CxxC-x17-CxxC domain-containing protein
MVFKRKFPKRIFKGHWTCANCGKEITELPFNPASDRPVYCNECWREIRTEKFSK